MTFLSYVTCERWVHLPYTTRATPNNTTSPPMSRKQRHPRILSWNRKCFVIIGTCSCAVQRN